MDGRRRGESTVLYFGVEMGCGGVVGFERALHAVLGSGLGVSYISVRIPASTLVDNPVLFGHSCFAGSDDPLRCLGSGEMEGRLFNQSFDTGVARAYESTRQEAFTKSIAAWKQQSQSQTVGQQQTHEQARQR